MSAYQRTKGHNWERKMASWFRDRGFPQAKRGLQTQPSYKPPDIEGTSWWVECKVGARPNILAAIRQAQEDLQKAQEGGFGAEYVGGPMVVAKVDREAPTVTMSLEAFEQLLLRNVYHNGPPTIVVCDPSTFPNTEDQ